MAEPTCGLISLIKHQKLKNYVLSIPWARKPVWFGLVLFNQKGERFEKELTLDGTPKTQDCSFPMSILSEVVLPKQNPFQTNRINKCPFWLMDLEVFKPLLFIVCAFCNDFMLFKLFSWLAVDTSDSSIYSILLYLFRVFICIWMFLSKQLFSMS